MARFKVFYFPIRGRAEVLKLICVAGGAEFEMVDVNYEAMKVDRGLYPFGQCPAMTDVDEGVHLAQSNAIVRYLARRLNLYGGPSLKEQARIDEVIEGVESLRLKYLALIYQDQLADAAKAAFWETHLAADSANARNGGAHLAYLEGLLTADYFAGGRLSVADICTWEMFDLLHRIWKDDLTKAYPKLAAHYARVAAADGIKGYLASPQRLEKVNNNGLG